MLITVLVSIPGESSHCTYCQSGLNRIVYNIMSLQLLLQKMLKWNIILCPTADYKFIHQIMSHHADELPHCHCGVPTWCKYTCIDYKIAVYQLKHGGRNGGGGGGGSRCICFAKCHVSAKRLATVGMTGDIHK